MRVNAHGNERRRLFRAVILFLMVVAFFATGSSLYKADEYDDILMTRDSQLVFDRFDGAINKYRELPAAPKNLVGQWVAPDGGRWIFEQNGHMGAEGRHKNYSYSLNGDILTWSCTTKVEQYQVHFYAEYTQLYLADVQSGNCVFCLQRLDHYERPVTDLTQGAGQPAGNLDVVGVGSEVIFVAGWAFDPDDVRQSAQCMVTVGGPLGAGEESMMFPADIVREDVAGVYGIDKYHGFAGTIYTGKEGKQIIYVYIQDYPSGNLVLLGYAHVDLPSIIAYDNDAGIRIWPENDLNKSEFYQTLEDDSDTGVVDYDPYSVMDWTGFTQFSQLLRNEKLLYKEPNDQMQTCPAQYFYLFNFDDDPEKELLIFAQDDWYAIHWEILDKDNDGWIWDIARDITPKPGNAGHGLLLIDDKSLHDVSSKGLVGYEADWDTYIYYENGYPHYLKSFFKTTYDYNEEDGTRSETYESEYLLNGEPITSNEFFKNVQLFTGEAVSLFDTASGSMEITEANLRWLEGMENK